MASSFASLEERAGYRIEEYATRVVENIQRCVDILRSVPEFSPKGKTDDVSKANLYTRVNQEGLCTSLRVSVQLVATDLGRRDPFAFVERDSMKDERIMLVKEVLIPLFGALAQCYTFLDGLPQPTPTPTNGSNGPTRDKQQKPVPPYGMLSLKDYTDIAVLLEFLVCTSILPNLDNNVLTSVTTRAKHLLPKSMSGRIPRKSLLWGHKIYKRRPTEIAVEELECTIAIIGELVLLDRFRPMLMPRHLTDLYAGIFQESHMRLAETPRSCQYEKIGEMLFPGPNSVVDTVSQAKTCQTLLLKGTKGPKWLREVVSDLLTDLTCRDLRAIVYVFVRQASSSQTDMTSASLRLAGPLTSVKNNKRYYKRLSAQLVSLLDAEGPLEEVLGDANVAAGALTVVSVLDAMSLEHLHRYFLRILTRNLLEPIYSTFEIHRFIRRLGLLLGVIPEAHNSFKIGLLCKTPFEHSDHPGSRVSILGQLIRIGAIQSTLKVQIKEDALMALRLMFRAMAQARYPKSGGSDSDGYSDGTDVLSLALLHTLQDSWWDKHGYKYKVSVPEGKNGMTGIAVEQEEFDSADITAILDTLETRVSFVIERLIVPLASSIQIHQAINGTSSSTDSEAIVRRKEDDQEIISEDGNKLVSSFFHLLLICYFNVMSKGSGKNKRRKGDKGEDNANDLEGQFAIMVALPMLCEMCPPDALILGGRKGGGKSILKMMKVILSSATSGIERPVEEEPESDESALATRQELKMQVTMGRMLTRSLSNQSLEIVEEADPVEQDPKEEGLLSTASVVLSLLIAMLELGIKRRNPEEELILDSMLPTLRLLTFAGKSSRVKSDDDVSQIRSEMAEMATHATALIVSRGAEDRDVKHHDDARSFEELLEDAERDLKSDQPPIRARGLVTLRHVARGWLVTMDDSSSSGRPLIEEIDASNSRLEPAIDMNPVREILRVVLVALEDKESYVFLAGIQTVVAAADARPYETLPLVSRALCTGTVQLRGKDVRVSTEQRIKLAEALSFIVRRRGDAINDYIPNLMQLLIHGKGMESMRFKLSLEKHDTDSFRKETHEYFNGSGISNFSSDDDGELKAVRVKAGGPIFVAEESDVLRSACINVVSELLSVAEPNIMATYCFDLVKLAKSALVLEISRPVRRSAAFMSRELYAVVLRELDIVLERHEHGAYIIPEQPMLLTLSECGEEALQVTLEQCVSRTGDNYDPATTARCEEALNLRQEISALGLFAAAEIYIMTAERDKEDLKAQLIRKRLGEQSKNGGRGIRKLLFGRGRGKRRKNEAMENG